MVQLLRIDSSFRREGSHSRALGDHLEAHWRASPLYNLGSPSTLKAWLDHVIRVGHTLEYRDGEFSPRQRGRKAYVITVRGGLPQPGVADDFQAPHLQASLRFLGWPAVTVIDAPGMAGPETVREQSLGAARRAIARCFEGPELSWLSEEDPEAISAIEALRGAQAHAILAGDAQSYAELCTEDVRLLLPGRPMVSGRSAFLLAERQFFEELSFERFEKHPLHLTLGPDLAVEVGEQEVTSTAQDGARTTTHQKYVHVFRRTVGGWRFQALTSNLSEPRP